MSAPADIEGSIKDYILSEFLEGEDPAMLSNTTPLITAGILNSIATLKLVAFLEETFSVGFEAHETDAEHLNTIELIAALIRSKR